MKIKISNGVNKKIVLAIGFLILLAGGIFAWQYLVVTEEKKEIPKEEIEAIKDKKLIITLEEYEILHFTTPEGVERKTIKMEPKSYHRPLRVANNKIYYLKKGDFRMISSVNLEGEIQDLEFTSVKRPLSDFLISPGGRRIVWTTIEGYMGKDRQIFVADIDGKNKKLLDFKLPDPFVFVSLVKWSSDEQHVYFVFYPVINGGGYLPPPYPVPGGSIFKININSEEITPIFEFDRRGEISPDERKLAYFNNEIVIKDLITGDRTVFPVGEYPIADFQFSPDSKHLAVTLGIWDMEDEKFKTIIVINLDRKEKWVIVPETPDLYSVEEWLTNEKIILSTWRGEKKGTYLINRDGSDFVQISKFPFVGIISNKFLE